MQSLPSLILVSRKVVIRAFRFPIMRESHGLQSPKTCQVFPSTGRWWGAGSRFDGCEKLTVSDLYDAASGKAFHDFIVLGSVLAVEIEIDRFRVPIGGHQEVEERGLLHAPLHKERINDDLLELIVAHFSLIAQVCFEPLFRLRYGGRHVRKRLAVAWIHYPHVKSLQLFH